MRLSPYSCPKAQTLCLGQFFFRINLLQQQEILLVHREEGGQSFAIARPITSFTPAFFKTREHSAIVAPVVYTSSIRRIVFLRIGMIFCALNTFFTLAYRSFLCSVFACCFVFLILTSTFRAIGISNSIDAISAILKAG